MKFNSTSGMIKSDSKKLNLWSVGQMQPA